MFAFLDTETTGFASGGVQPRMVQIAWLVANHPDRPQAFTSSIIQPDGFEIPVSASRVHHISTARAA